MISVNLIPRDRMRAAGRRDRLRVWVIATGIWCAALSVACALFAGFESNAPAENRLAELRQHVEEGRAALARTRTAGQSASRSLRAVKAAGEHPDWSILLGLLGALRGDDAMLESVDLQPVQSAPEPTSAPAKPSAAAAKAKAAAAPAPRARELYRVKITGLARTPSAAAKFVLKLEQTGIFDRVQLLQTTPREVGGLATASFNVECDIGEKPLASAEQGGRP